MRWLFPCALAAGLLLATSCGTDDPAVPIEDNGATTETTDDATTTGEDPGVVEDNGGTDDEGTTTDPPDDGGGDDPDDGDTTGDVPDVDEGCKSAADCEGEVNPATCEVAVCNNDGTCGVGPMACDDADQCTDDTCENDACVFTEIPDCESCDAIEVDQAGTLVACDFIAPDSPQDTSGCSWCQLLETECNALNAVTCIEAANDLAATGAVPASPGGTPIFPSCQQPQCDSAIGRCVLSAIPNCCDSAADCTDQSTCAFVTCEAEDDANLPPHLLQSDVNYCQHTLQPDCCAQTPNQLFLEETFSSFPDLPADWTVVDDNLADQISWYELQGSENCASGGHCIHLGYNDGQNSCFTYANQTIDPETCTFPEAVKCLGVVDCQNGNACVPDEQAASNCAGGDSCHCTPTAITMTLSAPQVDLQPAGLPWAFTFNLRMHTEPPFEDVLPGDTLTLWIITEKGESEIFNSAKAFNNNTGGDFEQVAIDLTAFAGQTVDFEFRFDTIDGENNDKFQGQALEGVIIDDVSLQSICQNELCTKNNECATADPCDQELCAVFQPKTALVGEPTAGFCINPPLAGVCDTCSEDADCVTPPNDGKQYDEQGACVALICKYTELNCLGDENLVTMSFEMGIPETWTTQDDGSCGNFWTISSLRSTDGAGALHFGHADSECGDQYEQNCGGLPDNICPVFECEQPAETTGHITTEEYDLPTGGNLLLNFDLFMSTEWDAVEFLESYCEQFAQCDDRLQLFAVYDGKEVEVWDSFDIGNTTGCQFQNINVNISDLEGKKVAFKFLFDSVDFGNDFNDYEGVYIDNFKVDSKCEIDCQTDEQCKEILAATLCDIATCQEGKCELAPKPFCCFNDNSCDQGSPCQIGFCELGDGATGTCNYEIDYEAAGCCTPDATYWTEDFEGTSLPGGWEIEIPEGSPDNVKWYWNIAGGMDGSAGLVFNDSTTGTYESANAAVKGAITSPPVQVPPGGTPTLKFDLFLSTEFDEYAQGDFESYLEILAFTYFDRLQVQAIVGGSPGPILWRSDEGKPLKGTTGGGPGQAVVWSQMAFSLAPVAGLQNVQLRFEFDSLSGESNAFGGAKIDNLEISQACGNDPCLADAYCDDGDKCYINTCEAGLCESAENQEDGECCFATADEQYSFEDTDEGFEIIPDGDAVRWHPSTLKARSGKWSLRMGNVADETYSSCTCDATDEGPVCATGCPVNPGFCETESGKAAPGGKVKSKPFTMKKGQDYTLDFSMFVDLATAEGDTGFAESFTVKLMRDGGMLGDVEMLTLVCHASICDSPDFDPCKSGINFEYPLCLGASDPGHYQKWNDYSFKMSELLCDSTGSVVESFLETLNAGQAEFFLQVEVKLLDNLNNCDSGVYLDAVSLNNECIGWDGVCK